MMIEPPRKFGLRGELEIDNRIHVAIEQRRIPRLVGRVHHPPIEELRAGVKFFAQEAAEEGGRSGAVKAVIVMENAYPHVQ